MQHQTITTSLPDREPDLGQQAAGEASVRAGGRRVRGGKKTVDGEPK